MRIEIDVPSKVLAELDHSRDRVARDIRLATAVEWYRRGYVSLVKAAQVAQSPTGDFVDELAAREVPVTAIDGDDVTDESTRGGGAWET